MDTQFDCTGNKMDKGQLEMLMDYYKKSLRTGLELGFSMAKAKSESSKDLVQKFGHLITSENYAQVSGAKGSACLEVFGGRRGKQGRRKILKNSKPAIKNEPIIKTCFEEEKEQIKNKANDDPRASLSLKGAMFSSCEYGFLPDPEFWRKLAKDGSYADGSVDSNLSLIKHSGKYLLTKCEHGFLVTKTLDQITVLTVADIERLLNNPEQRKAILKKLLEEAE